MDVLIIVPFRTDLAWGPSESQDLANILRGHLLQGEVTERTLAEAIREKTDGGETYQGIWLSTHGNDQGVQLSDGFLSARDVAGYVNQAGAEWVFLNSCSSDGLADSILAYSAADVIATLSDVPDREAWRTGRRFAIALSRTRNIDDARSSIATNARYKHWPNDGRKATREMRNSDGADVERRLRDLEIIVKGNEDWQLAGLQKTVEEIRRMVKRNRKTNLVTIGLLVLLLIAILALALLVRSMGAELAALASVLLLPLPKIPTCAPASAYQVRFNIREDCRE